MVNTSSSLALDANSSEKSSSLSHDQSPPPKRVCREAPGRGFPRISWLTENWLSTSNRHERIATASPGTGTGLIPQSLLEHHINRSPGINGVADFTPVRDGTTGQYLGYRPKVATWPLSKQDALKYKDLGA
ncbi:hypothetical protein DHEL01_v201820 [Diaporthe helianthi]|uniref:Uncharacterized protein n=1 Tax=Diaporthe helianthi TaxID=158607 RepID=A0A2P5IBA2_DIAHE|nr:hypothetical protein DHEL01_v201820 [Diaporthe helianthi]